LVSYFHQNAKTAATMKDNRLTTQEPAFESILNAEPDVDDIVTLPLVVLLGQVVFPYMMATLTLEGAANAAAAEHALQNHQTLITALRRASAPKDAPLLEAIHTISTESALQRLRNISASLKTVMAEGRRRVEILEVVQTEPYILVKASLL